MGEILAVLLAFPAVFFTVITVLSVLYWLFVIIGALDMDALGGAEHGVLEGAVGAAKGIGHIDGGHDIGGHDVGGHDAGDGDLDAGFLSFLGLRNVPLTIVIS